MYKVYLHILSVDVLKHKNSQLFNLLSLSVELSVSSLLVSPLSPDTMSLSIEAKYEENARKVCQPK